MYLNSGSLETGLASQATGTNRREVGDLTWWKHAVFYQIYPRSFKDNNNDGIGDLLGIIEKLPHLQDAGVTALWISPIFQSPQVDQGYDISDYTQVDPDYGTNEDLQNLIATAHELGLKVILDFVPNHTSDKHRWFIDSEDGKEGFEDFYVWKDAKKNVDGENQPPNNWLSLFRNSSWTWSKKRQQYYLHQFAAAQPDLNYRNPKVVEAMKDVLRFWLDNGVDGFRIDAVPFLIEDEGFNDEPLSDLPGYNSTDYQYLEHNATRDLPETFDIVYDWRDLMDRYTQENGGDQRVIMTEAYSTPENTMLYYGTPDGSRLGAHFTFNFNLVVDVNINSTAEDFTQVIQQWLDLIPSIYTSNWVLGNHDNHRVASRLGPANVDGFNMLMALLPGVGVTYNGEEIGQEDGEVSFEQGQDPSARDPAIFEKVSRDFERTPFQWDDSINAGFNEGAEPWLPVSEKFKETNLAAQILNGKSHYHIYQKVLKLRQGEICSKGTTEVKAVNDNVLLLKRSLQDESIILLFNIGDDVEVVNIIEDMDLDNTILINSVDSQYEEGDMLNPASVTMNAHESMVLRSTVV